MNCNKYKCPECKRQALMVKKTRKGIFFVWCTNCDYEDEVIFDYEDF